MYRLSLSRFLYHEVIESVSTPNGWDVPISTPVGERHCEIEVEYNARIQHNVSGQGSNQDRIIRALTKRPPRRPLA